MSKCPATSIFRPLLREGRREKRGGRRVGIGLGSGLEVLVTVVYEIHAEPMTPENKADVAICVFIRPRVHRVRVFPVTSPKMTLTGREGSSCGISEIGERLKELIDGG